MADKNPMMLFHCFSVCREPDFPGSDGGADRKELSADSAGKQWKTDACFKMLGRTLLHNNSRECYLSACAKEGSDIVTISISGDPCDLCARYENRLLSISGKTQGLVTLEQAMSEGLFHPNCTHRMIAVPEVVAQEYYDKDGKEKTEYRVDWENHLLHQQIRKEQREEARLNREDRKKAEEDRKKAAHEAHLKHRQKQLSQAKKNRTKREAELIGADLIKGEHTREQDLMAVNPNFDYIKDVIWKYNCQRCITAYEARRRGIDVTAKPRPPLTEHDYLSRSCGWSDAYKNGKIISCVALNGKAAKNKIIKAINQMPDGSRCAVQIRYKRRRGGGHVFIAEYINGNVLFIDPQPNGYSVMFDQSEIFSQASGRDCFIMRLDNLKFSDTVKECCEGVKND